MTQSDRVLVLYNTETKKRETIHPIEGDKIKMYTCGPTVYNFAHIGNFRTYVAEDLLRRAFEYFGSQVFQVMNITDVDDKTIKGATEKDLSLSEFTKPFIEAFFEDLKTLNIQQAADYPKATDYLSEMIEMIQELLDKNHAYVGSDNSIYFSINSFSSYGRLSHLKLEELKKGASNRVEDEYDKDNASDFVLWKSYDAKRDGKIYWESPFGKGRPGWHLECSCMAIKILGKRLDIHCGGVDNIFPHHENEIAQSECCTNERFVRHWFHIEHLLVDNKKMSKSAGNFYTLRDLLEKGYTGREIRYLLVQTHYKTQLNFTFEGLEGARSSLSRIDSFVDRVQSAVGRDTTALTKILEEQSQVFSKGLSEDLNISFSLASLFDLIRKVNALLDNDEVGKSGRVLVLDLLKDFDHVLGLIFFKTEEKIDPKIIEALEKRQQARKEKDFTLADKLRDEILSAGYEIEDTLRGARLKRREDVKIDER